MTAVIIILVVGLLGALFIFPWKVAVSVRFCLDRNKCFIYVKLLGLKLVRIKLENKNNCIRMSVNGKKPKKKGNDNPRNVPRVLNYMRGENVIKKVVCIGIIGGETAEDSAYNFGVFSTVLCTLLPSADTAFVYPDFKSNRLDLDMSVYADISIFQALRAIVV